MNEEMMTYEELNVENTEVNEETYVEPKSSGISTVGAFVGGTLVAGAVGVGAWLLNKTKDKREAAVVKKLEKKGYVVYKAEEIEDAVVEDIPENEDETK